VAPRDPEMLSLLGQIKVEQGLPRDAIATFRRLDRVRPLTGSEHIWVARAYYNLGRRMRGRGILMRQLAERSSARVVIAFAENELDHDPQRARQLLESLPDSGGPGQRATVLELLTAIDIKEQKYQDALQRVNAAFEAGEATPATLLLRAKVLLAMGQLAAGERDLLAMIGRAGMDAEAVDLLAKLYTAQGRADEAIQSFEEAAQAGVLPPGTQVLLARLYLSEGNVDRAIELLSEAVESESDLPHAKNDLAYLLAERGQNLDYALQLAQEARAELPNDPNTADTLGWVLLQRGLSTAAIEQFREAIGTAEKKTQTAMFHHHMGLALKASGRLDDAR
jgi:tetratricopeptide (TPR) repeat protein